MVVRSNNRSCVIVGLSFGLKVPKWSSFDNFPHATYSGPFIVNTLYVYDVIPRRIEAKVVPSEELTEKVYRFY